MKTRPGGVTREVDLMRPGENLTALRGGGMKGEEVGERALHPKE